LAAEVEALEPTGLVQKARPSRQTQM